MGLEDRDWMIERTKKRLRDEDKRFNLNIKTTTNKTRIKILVAICLYLVVYTLFINNGNLKTNIDIFRIVKEPFPGTNDLRWFSKHSSNNSKETGQMKIIGLTDSIKNSVVRLDDWDTHQPVVLIPIRGNEVAVLNVPFGKYRVIYTLDATWRNDFSLSYDSREVIKPMEFY
ncbi:hypothetical protein GW796_07160 [archaeon]|nr:hypothetical protein [archaeon]